MKTNNFFSIILLINILSLFVACNNKQLVGSTWKNCGDFGIGADLLIFNKDVLYVKNDTIYYTKKDSAIAIIDRIEYYYGERRLFVKSLMNKQIGRYCEQ